MSAILTWIESLPSAAYYAAAAVVVLIGVIVWRVVHRHRFRTRLLSAARGENPVEFTSRYTDRAIRRHSRLVEKTARRFGPEVIRVSGADELWIERLQRRPSRADFRRLLELSPDTGLFACFLAVLKRPSLRQRLFDWLDQQDDLLAMRRIALAGRGEEFSGRQALALFRDRIDEIREMMGDPEWAPRYFATKIILYDGSDRSKRLLWDAFRDGHPLVRGAVAAEFETDEADRLYDELNRLYLHDPIHEVRKSARQRINAQFSERFRIDREQLTPVAARHVLGLLEPGNSEDENIAIEYLADDSAELRLPAALFLQRIGALDRLIRDADLGDMEALERSFSLLKNAAAVDVSGFLSVVESSTNAGTLLLACRVLSEAGDPDHVPRLLDRVSRLSHDTADLLDLYDSALTVVERRGTEPAFRRLLDEFRARKRDPAMAPRICSHIPERASLVFLGPLFDALLDPSVPSFDELRSALMRIGGEGLVPKLIDTIEQPRSSRTRVPRSRALKLLAELGRPGTSRYVLENLWTLAPEEALDVTRALVEHDGTRVNEDIAALLDTDDARVRAYVIRAVPATGRKDAVKQVRAALSDADPDVRIAAMWTMLELGDTRSFNQAASQLRDPVERVRREAARALGAHGSAKTVQEFSAILADENEVDVVKRAAIEGLGRSPEPAAVDVLVERLASGEGLAAEIVSALSRKTSQKELAVLVERMKDAGPQTRDHIAEVFRRMGEESEGSIRSLLQSDIASLRPIVTEILERVGFVDSMIRRLAHRDSDTRREAAATLATVGTTPAFRGLVRAAQDPDEGVRIEVTKALERLETGGDILNALREDPDRRVRKYTHWALQRIEAKSLSSEDTDGA